jgi:hypothetical protein
MKVMSLDVTRMSYYLIFYLLKILAVARISEVGATLISS